MSEESELNAASAEQAANNPTTPEPRYGQRDPFLEANGFYNTPPRADPTLVSARPARPNRSRRPRNAGEDISRGVLFASLVIPLGVVAWLLLWSMGWMASFVAFGVSFGAAKLYLHGTEQQLSRRGVWAISIVTAATMLLSFFAGLWYDVAKFMNLGVWESLLGRTVWFTLFDNMANNPDYWPNYVWDLLSALLFGALGSFFLLYRLFKQTK